MKEVSPHRIGQVAIYRSRCLGRERAAHRITLKKASLCDEVRIGVSHAIKISRRPEKGAELERHVVSKMHPRKAIQNPVQRTLVTEMKGIEQRLGPARGYR